MRIRGDQLSRLAARKGAAVEELAEAVTRTGLGGERAASAIRNWMRGSDHPRCKPEDVRNLARVLDCEVGQIASFTSRIMHHRGSPRKARLLADLVRGRSYQDALNNLTFTTKRAAVNMRKALDAAKDEAEGEGVDVGDMVVAVCTVDQGPTIKRFRPKDRGRAHPIAKRTSHIIIGVHERTEGRN